jgi:hypothetical protein
MEKVYYDLPVLLTGVVEEGVHYLVKVGIYCPGFVSFLLHCGVI